MPHHAGPHVEAPKSIRGQRSEGRAQATAFTGVSMGKVMQGRVNRSELAGLNNSSGLWAHWRPKEGLSPV